MERNKGFLNRKHGNATGNRKPGKRPVKVIWISVDGKGNFTYQPSSYRAEQGDTIRFRCRGNHPFEVAFVGRTPGNRMYLSNRAGRATPSDGKHVENLPDHRDPAALTIASTYKEGEENTIYGVYRYAVAIYDGTHVWIDSGCGDISVVK